MALRGNGTLLSQSSTLWFVRSVTQSKQNDDNTDVSLKVGVCAK